MAAARAPGLTERWRAGDGAELAFRPHGRGGARPALLLHSPFFDGTMFDAVPPALGDRPAILPDHRGQGASGAGREAPTAERLAADMVALLDALGTGPVHLVGSSMGAYVALEMPRADPARVASLTLSCCTCRPGAHPVRFAALARRIESIRGRGLRAELVGLMFGAPFLADPVRAALRDRWIAHLDALPAGSGKVVRAVFAHGGWTDLLRGWGGPILALSGGKDRAKSPADLAWIAEEGLRRHVTISRAGHTPAVETPAPSRARLPAEHDIERTPA